MSPRPFRATITLVMRSGMDVPAARMVRPMISSEMPIVSPTWVETGHQQDFSFGKRHFGKSKVYMRLNLLSHNEKSAFLLISCLVAAYTI